MRSQVGPTRRRRLGGSGRSPPQTGQPPRRFCRASSSGNLQFRYKLYSWQCSFRTSYACRCAAGGNDSVSLTSIRAHVAARSNSPPRRGPCMPFTKKLSGGKRSETFISWNFLAITPAAEPVIQRGIRKRVSKQATAKLRSRSDEVPSRKDCIAGVGFQPCVG